MKVMSAAWIIKDKYPLLKVETDLGTATLMVEAKPILDEKGIVFLGSQFEDLVDPINLPADPQDNRGSMVLKGFTQDPTIVSLYRDFQKAVCQGPFSVRTIPI